MKGKNSLMAAAGLYLILGLVLLLFPGLTTAVFCVAVGVLLLLYGVVTILSFFAHRGSSTSFTFQAELILGILSAIVGAFFLTHSDFIISVIPAILGLYVVIDGLVNLKRGLDMRAFGYAGWTATLVMSLVSLALGAVILRHPFGVGLTLWRIIGAAFLYQGLSDLWAILTLNKLTKDE